MLNLVLLEPVKVSQSNEYTRYLISTHNFTSLYIYGAQDNGECDIYFENLTHYDTPTGTKESVQLEVYYGYTLNAHVVEKEQYEFIGYFSEPNGKGKQLTDNEGYPIGGRWLFEEDTTIYAYYVLIAVTAEETIVEYRKDWEINYTQNIPGNIEIKYYDQEGNEVVPFEIGEYKVIINYESEEYGSSSVESILKIIGPTPSEDFTIYGRNDVDNEYRYAYYHGNDKLVFADSEITRYGLNMNVTLLDYALFSGHSELEEIVIGKGINKIDYWCFYETSLNKVYYEGNIEEWNDIVIMSDGNELLESATIYFYSKEEPTSAGNYWHYVDGNPVAWN